MTAIRDEWHRGGTENVAAGVFRIPLPMPNDRLRAINVYAIEDATGITLIDAGWATPQSRHELERSLAEIGWRLDDIRCVLVTHHHRDHYSQAVALRREFGTTVAIGTGERANLASVERDPRYISTEVARLLVESGGQRLLEEIRTVAAGWAQVDPADWEPADRWLRSGEVIELGTRRLAVVPTPGHTRGHVIYHDRAAELIFAGDHVLPHITPSIGFEPLPTLSPLSDYLRSLDVMAGLGCNTLLPAHGPTHPSATARIAELVEHHRVRLAETSAAVGEVPRTVTEVAERLRWTRRALSFSALDTNDQITAVIETSAHLRLLAERRDVHVWAGDDGIWRYGEAFRGAGDM